MPLRIDHNLESLLLKISRGDEAAFAKIFDQYRPNIYATALRITRDELTSEEIVQDTFLKVWIARENLGNIENFGGWIFIVARNVTYDAIRRAKKEKEHVDKLAKDSIGLCYPEADYKVQEKEFQDILVRAVDRLPDKQRDTYRLIKEEFLKRNEAAQRLNVSAETVKWNLDQAMRSVRAYCLAHINDMPVILILHFLSGFF